MIAYKKDYIIVFEIVTKSIDIIFLFEVKLIIYRVYNSIYSIIVIIIIIFKNHYFG